MGVRVAPATPGWVLALAWLAGAALQLRQPSLWPDAVVAALAVLATVLAAVSWPHRQRGAALVALALAVAVLAFSTTALRASWRLSGTLPAVLEGQDIELTGVVTGLPRVGATGTQFVLEVDSATWQGRRVTVPRRVSLGWYRPWDEGLLASPLPDLRAGQRWQLTVRLQQPHGLSNPHGFDVELWLFERGLRATGSVRTVPGAVMRRLADGEGRLVDRIRQQIRDAVVRRVGDPGAAGVIAALAVGDQAAISRDDWDLFRNTGVAHLMSISGLHVTMFAWLVGGIASRLWRLSPRAMHRLPAPQAARWAGLAAAFGYAAVAGWGVPAQRTVAMIAVVVLLRSGGWRWPLLRVLLAAAAAVTLLDPWALLQPGFWLSFVAVALLVASEPARPEAAVVAAAAGPDTDADAKTDADADPRPNPRRRWLARLATTLRSAWRTQAIATIGLTPLTLVFFQQVSVVGFVANLVAIPLVTLLITPLALAGVVAAPLWELAGALVQALSMLLQWLSAWPFAVWTAAAAPGWAVAAGLLGAVLAIAPLPWRLRVLSLPLMLPLLWPPVDRPPPGRFEVVAADVGQGTAVLVRTRDHLLVYDAGPAYSAQSDAGERVLLPLLRARGERRIDTLVLSHRDGDHVGGAASLLAALPVGGITSSLGASHPLLAGGVVHRRCDAGQRWDWDGVTFEVLHPLPADHERAAPGAVRPNALSCVLRIAGTGTSLLLAGDIEAAQEAALVDRAGPALRADVLLVPHHGSRTSSSPGFVDAVRPLTAVVQAAYRNRYGHPAFDVEARYVDRGVTLVRSDRCGAWTLAADGSQRCERSAARRYWHWPGVAGPEAPR